MVAWVSAAMSALADPSDQNNGEARNSRSSGPSPCRSPISNPFSMRCLWVSATPFGRAVEPDVNNTMATSSAGATACRSLGGVTAVQSV